MSAVPMLRTARRLASRVKHGLFPPAEVAAWRRAARLAGHTSRHTPGEIVMNGYTIRYTDLLTLCPQWEDIFVHGSLRFNARTDCPRVIDAGANIGLAALYFKRLYPAARVTCYEADPVLAGVCRRNLEANGAGDVDVRAAAVWTSTGTVRFQQEGSDSGAIEGSSAGLRAPSIEVPSIRLRDVLAAEPIDLLKLDIEGAEGAVLEDCAGALDSVGALLLDLHEFDPMRRQTARVLDLLAAAGFEVALGSVTPLPWRGGDVVAFPGAAPVWASLVRAWRPRA